MKFVRCAIAAVVAITGIAVGTTSAGAAADRGPCPKATIVRGAGDLAPTIAKYQQLLGPDNGGVAQSFPAGRREINWDGVPDEFSEPNAYPPDFFNSTTEPRARGVVLSTPGDHLGVSADSDNPSGAPVRFGDINPTYVDTFRTNSPEKLFSPVGSNVATIKFYVPGTEEPAATRGFGAVYTDVDHKETAAFRFFDKRGKVLCTYAVPVSKDGLSFLGVAY
ncbi:MAG TPA: hypothetical protein VIH82_06395, partial [Acidimicrobiia bacterium]